MFRLNSLYELAAVLIIAAAIYPWLSVLDQSRISPRKLYKRYTEWVAHIKRKHRLE